jgi:hypothetical protein
MMEVERMEIVPSFDRNNIMYTPKLEHSFDDIQAKTKTSTLRSELTGSFGIDAARVVELDLSYDDDSEDEGEIMLLAMILLQLHGVKFPGGFPDQHNKKKRQRTSPDQLAILEQIFQTDKMPSQQTRVQLADQLGMSSRRVQIWFQNKRAKVKRGLGKSSDGFQQPPMSPHLDIDRDGCTSLSSSSCLSEPSSPLVPDSSFHGSPSSSPPLLSLLSTTPPSPNSPAVVPSSPSLPRTPKQLSPQVTQLQFSLSSLASQPILFTSEFSSMSSLLRAQGV